MLGPAVCTLVNRTSDDLEVIWDGQPFILHPGVNENVPQVVALFAKRQHPVMGTENPYSWDIIDCKVGIKVAKGDTQKDDISKLTAADLNKSVERLDRTHLPAASVEDSGMRISRASIGGPKPSPHVSNITSEQ